MFQSAVYVGRVRHRRRTPAHAFTFPMFMVYLDLAELDRVLSLTRWWGRSRLCPARFDRSDYLSGEGLGLDECVRACVRSRLGRAPAGPIRMLTHLRYFGHVFNPVTFYYCFDPDDRLDAVVAEITNTPWKERFAYVLDARAAAASTPAGRPFRWRFAKEFHVSPFMPMELEYDWRLSIPGDSVLVHMNLRERRTERERTFDATLRMRRREISPGLLRTILLRFPLMTLHVVWRIHFEALRLWFKGARVHRHPRTPKAATANKPAKEASA